MPEHKNANPGTEITQTYCVSVLACVQYNQLYPFETLPTLIKSITENLKQ